MFFNYLIPSQNENLSNWMEDSLLCMAYLLGNITKPPLWI